MKVNIVVEGSGGSLKDFDLKKDESLPSLIGQIVSQLGLTNPDQYALYNQDRNVYVDETALSRGDVNAPQLLLKRKPELDAKDLISALKDSDMGGKKRCLPKLKSRLSDKAFMEIFISMDGINLVTLMVKEIGEDGSKSVLSFVLNVMERLLNMNIGWEHVDPELPYIIIPFIGHTTNSNICAKAMQIATYLSQSANHGFFTVDNALRALAEQKEEKPYQVLMAHLNNTDLNVQTSCLRLINSIFNSIDDESRKKEYLDMMTELGINKVLQHRRHLTDTNLKEEVYQFQRVRLWQLSRERIPYDKNDADHEAKLQVLWDLVFPDEALEARVCNQWKGMGFQGQDPATDFRGMGMLGLNNLIYVAEHHAAKFSKIVNTQRDRKDHDYPVAVAGINITQMLYELMFVEKEDPAHTVFPLLFDHPHAFEEVYFIAFELLNHTWDAMNAEYMDFPKVMESVRMKLQMIFSSSPNLDQIKSATRVAGAVPRSAGSSSSAVGVTEGGPVGELRAEVEVEMSNMVRNQKMEFLRDGCAFEVAVGPSGKSKASSENKGKTASSSRFIYVKLCKDELSYGPVSDLDAKLGEFPMTVKASECTDVVVGLDCPIYSGAKGKKADETRAGLTFALMLTSGEDLCMVARTSTDFIHWTDGLRVWLGKMFSHPDSLDDLKALVDAEMEVRLLDLAGVTIPTTAPPVPSLPQNYDFAIDDESELANRPVGKPKCSSPPRRGANFTMGGARRAGFTMGSRRGPAS